MNQGVNKRSASKRFAPLGIIFTVLGLLLFAYFVKRAGVGDITEGIRKLGAGFLLVLAASSLRYIAKTVAWTLCFEAPHKLRFRDAFKAYLIGDALGNLTPLGIVVSEPSKAALVRDRVPLIVGLSAVAVQNLFYSLSVLLFIFSGTVALLLSFPLPEGLRIISFVTLGVVVVVASIGYAIVRLRLKFLSKLVARLGRRGLGQRLLKKRRESTSELEDTVYGFYARNPLRCLLIMLLESSFHLAGVLEVYITLYFISDVPPTFLTAFILESVNRVINVVFKFVPLRAGVDEAGTGLLTTVLNLGMASGVTLAVVRKARLIIWMALGLILLISRGLSPQSIAEETETAIADEVVAANASAVVPVSE